LPIKVDRSRIDIRKLTLADDVADFSCGQKDLDEYILYQAVDQQLDGAAVVYLAWLKNQIVGFLSLNMSNIESEHIAGEHRPAHTPYLYFPSLMIGRLATDKRFWRQGIGTLLCQFAISTAIKMRKSAGCQFVILNAKKNSVQFYQRCSFQLSARQRQQPFMYFKLPRTALPPRTFVARVEILIRPCLERFCRILAHNSKFRQRLQR
jgi:GNAT superfamily N-acetyltransferase